MPAPSPDFVVHCAELLAPLGTVGVRRMFGGFGLAIDGLPVAIVVGDRLYLKTSADSAADFAAAGCEPFRYRRRGSEQLVETSMWSAPEVALDTPRTMRPWAQRALVAARAAASKRRPAQRR